MTTEVFRMLGWGLGGGGLLLLAWAALLATRQSRRTRGWLRAGGEVVAREFRALTPGNPYYFPVIEFIAADGKPRRFEAPTGRFVRPDEVGACIDVLYDPAQPERAIIARFADRWFVAAFTAGFGALTLLLGLMLIGLTR